jgi:hypothetical protein
VRFRRRSRWKASGGVRQAEAIHRKLLRELESRPLLNSTLRIFEEKRAKSLAKSFMLPRLVRGNSLISLGFRRKMRKVELKGNPESQQTLVALPEIGQDFAGGCGEHYAGGKMLDRADQQGAGAATAGSAPGPASLPRLAKLAVALSRKLWVSLDTCRFNNRGSRSLSANIPTCGSRGILLY